MTSSKNKSSKKQITKKQIQKALSESVFNPNTPGPMSIIIGNHFDRPEYLLGRTPELINECTHFYGLKDLSLVLDKLTKAISLLAATKAIIQQKQEV